MAVILGRLKMLTIFRWISIDEYGFRCTLNDLGVSHDSAIWFTAIRNHELLLSIVHILTGLMRNKTYNRTTISLLKG